MRCQQCTAENPEGLNFCNQCGAQLGARCPKCGFGNAPGAKFCGECGAQLRSRLSDALSKTAAVAEQGPRDRVVATKSRLLRTHALVASFRGESCRGEICQSETDRRRRRSSRTRHRHFLRLRQVWRKHQYRGGAGSRGGNRAREGSENGVQRCCGAFGNRCLRNYRAGELLLVGGDPTTDMAALRKVVMVVKGGAILVDNT
jgi:Double zinc ribbon